MDSDFSNLADTRRGDQTLKLGVQGLFQVERELLEAVVRVSQRSASRRMQPLEILDDAQIEAADVILVDTRDARAMAWAKDRPWLNGKAVIWIDATTVRGRHTLVRRPVQWPILPLLLMRALEHASHRDATLATLNAETPALHSAAPGLALAEDGQSRPPILVVDDSLAVRSYLRSLLEQRGFAVVDADSVAATVQLLRTQTFACVLMDVLMPGTDGYEGCRQVKASQRGSTALPVIMLTSKSSPFDRIRGKMAGCDAYLTKPIDPSQLTEVLFELLRAATVRAQPLTAAHAADALMLRQPLRRT